MSPVYKDVVLKVCSDENCTYTSHNQDERFCGYCTSNLIIKCNKCNTIHTRLDLKYCPMCKADLRADDYDFGNFGL